jgi:hypothetical protein
MELGIAIVIMVFLSRGGRRWAAGFSGGRQRHSVLLYGFYKVPPEMVMLVMVSAVFDRMR